MADKRIRTNGAESLESEITQDAIITPTEQVKDNQYDSILQRLNEQDETIKHLTKKLAESTNDISEQVKESKRKYWYNIDWTRNPDELFKYWYRTLIHDRNEKVVVKTETIGRPVNARNENTGKWYNKHDIIVTFQDGTTTEMDVLDYINQTVKYEEFVQDKDIQVIDGVKNFTFRTDKFWTFTIPLNFIN
jgi:hypothetical protein